MLTRFLTKSLFRATAIKSVPGNLPPRKEDNAAGRYAGSLFSAASQKQHLDVVQQDLNWLGQLVKQSPEFKLFLNNLSIPKTKQRQVVESTISNTFSPTTKQFINLLIESGRLTDLPKIIEKYDQYVKILSKQQDIRIISAKTLNENERKQVVESLARGRPGVQFNVEYQIDPTILGGLQVYSGSTFLDCSLRSRLDKLKTELDKI